MHYYSTNNSKLKATFSGAVLNGIAPDGGLYFPDSIAAADRDFFSDLPAMDIGELAAAVLEPYATDIPEKAFQKIIGDTFRFDAPLVQLNEHLYVLELFHGPTLAFKDFGARFLANVVSFISRDLRKTTVILVATSGDTGSAVGNGFLNMPGIRVGLLYPSGKVSRIQEQQLTTMGHNVQAFEVKGDFDDCQRLVKQAFRDDVLKKKMQLSSANSINIARLLPQSVYYFRAYAQLGNNEKPPVVIVPSGNFGNLTAGLLAWKTGLPVKRFIAAVNRNNVFPDYLRTGSYRPREAFMTYSNAMDVGDPSNFVRIMEIFGGNHEAVKERIMSTSIDDAQTLEGIRRCYEDTEYILDPHGAVGYQAWNLLKTQFAPDQNYILLETAHPAKFRDSVEKAIDHEIDMPGRLAACLEKPKRAIPVGTDFEGFRDQLTASFCD